MRIPAESFRAATLTQTFLFISKQIINVHVRI